MWHLSLAWLWLMAGLVFGFAPVRSPLVSWWTPAALGLVLLLWRRSAWRGLLQPQRGVRALCWCGHALTVAAVLLLLATSSPLMADVNSLGLGLLLGLLLLPLPFLGAAAWLCQIVQLCKPALPAPGGVHKH